MDHPILILGSRAFGDRPGKILVSRLSQAVSLLKGRPDSLPIVVSGKGEAGIMARWLIEQGVDPDRIIEEPSATSTNENLENAQALLPDTDRWLVVTNDFHAWRTYLWAWHLNIPITVVTSMTPSSSRMKMLLRECLALPHSALRIAWRRLLDAGRH